MFRTAVFLFLSNIGGECVSWMDAIVSCKYGHGDAGERCPVTIDEGSLASLQEIDPMNLKTSPLVLNVTGILNMYQACLVLKSCLGPQLSSRSNMDGRGRYTGNLSWSLR